jgi:hypothetical protein
MRAISLTNLPTVLTVLLCFFTVARADDPKVVEQKLESEYTLTTVNAEGGVVTQGVVLTLKKGGLAGGPGSLVVNEYKDGRIAMTKASTARKIFGIPGISAIPGAGGAAGAAAQSSRPFVAGEKVYVTKIEVKDTMALTLVSDPIADVRYQAELKFPIQKGASLDLAQAERWITEVFKVAPPPPADQAQPAAEQAAPAQVSAVAPAAQPLPPVEPPPPPVDPAATAPIAPPPPPPDEPVAPAQTLSLGQTIDQVVAVLGKPATIADLGAKKIYTYKNPSVKVTFVNGKVTDMQ